MTIDPGLIRESMSLSQVIPNLSRYRFTICYVGVEKISSTESKLKIFPNLSSASRLPKTDYKSPGSTQTVIVEVARQGYNGDIALAFDGLPEGVTVAGNRILAGRTRGLVSITAANGDATFFLSAALVPRQLMKM